MPGPLPHPNPRRRLPAWVLVGLLHLLAVLAIWKLPVWADRTAPAQDKPPLVVRLWFQVTKPAPANAAPANAAPVRPAPRRTEPQAITWPAPPSAAPTGPSSVPGAEPAAPMASAPAVAASAAPLNLALPRGASAPWRQRNPALDDPRSNTAKLTMDQKLANAMGGDGSWAEERLDLDHIRYRRGDDCILVTRSRAGQLELGNGAFRNAWTVRPC
jgi:hypothetical protein